MTNTYKKAYTEVLEILKYLPQNEYNRIPREKIKFYESNKDVNYSFTFDTNKSLNEQIISREAKTIIVAIFRDYFATQQQQEKLQKILVKNEEIYQTRLKEKYNPDNLFKNKSLNQENIETENVALVEYKEAFFTRFKNWFKKLFK